MTRSALVLWAAVVAAEGVALAMAVRRLRHENGRGLFTIHACPRLRSLLAKLRNFAIWRITADSVHAEAKQEIPPLPATDARGCNHPPTLRPIVALLAFAVAEDIAVRLLIDLVINSAPRPLHGLTLAAHLAARWLTMGWVGALAWACWAVFVPKTSGFAASSERLKREGFDPQPAKAALPLDLLAACFVGFAASYAALRPMSETSTQAFLLAWELVALAFAGAAIVLGWRRAVRGAATWTVAHGVLLVLVPVEAAVCAIGPFARPSVFSAWEVARWQYLVGFAIVAGMLWRKGRPE